MKQMEEREVHYGVDKTEDLNFIIENYTMAKPFSSFFPGIAGLMGIPMWCFYVNRGQAVCSFGTESKDGAIMEFQPANKSYRLATTQGFRTFIKYQRDGKEGFYEPFQENQPNLSFQLKNKMTVTPYDLTLEETNASLGLGVKVQYFTIPGEPFAALARVVTVSNLLDTPVELDLVDGMPIILPYGMQDSYIKNMSRTMEAWACVENMENGIPYYRMSVSPEDSAEVIQIKSGNFYCGFFEGGDGIEMLNPINDPALVFGHINDLAYPAAFLKNDFKVSPKQQYTNRTECAMGHTQLKLAGKSEKTIYSLVGQAKDLNNLKDMSEKFLKADFFVKKAEENKAVVCEVMDKAFVHSSSREFNSYCKQNFLDNILRGGMPLTIRDGDQKDVLYVYSRRHGDLERDYNSFRLMPTYFSQGNGAFRDINQNRRNDTWFNPDTGYSNIQYFMNLIQLDGFNPLIVKGISYLYEEKDDNALLKSLVEENHLAAVLAFLKRPFIPYTLLNFVKEENIQLKADPQTLINKILLGSKKVEEAEHGEGYWSDHWHYNMDLLESYEALYPEKVKELLTKERAFTFYEDEYFVVPRDEKYIMTNGRPRQLGSLRKDKEKLALLASRKTEPNKVRTKEGRGEIYSTSLLVKLLSLCINKMASLDSQGVGIEMEGGKPNWNDAINGLPSFFGSSASETFELKRLLLMLRDWILRFDLKDGKIEMPSELEAYMMLLHKLLKENAAEDSVESNFKYWDASNTLKEDFRKSVQFGIQGSEKTVAMEFINEFIGAALAKVDRGLDKAYNDETGIYNTYFINEPTEYEVLGSNPAVQKQFVKVNGFKQIPLPPFLEGQVHAMRVERDPKRAMELYEAIRKTELYDAPLGMYKVNASLKAFPPELGRLRTFSPGWLENESVFMHMEYKYLLELLKSGLSAEFHRDGRTAFVPFMKPEVYGRSIFENSSFIAASVNPDESVRGNGFVARLSGTTAEFYNILLVMALGNKPFMLNTEGELEFRLNPSIPGDLFTTEEAKVKLLAGGTEQSVVLDENTYTMRILGDTLLVYHNEKRLDTFGPNGARILKICIEDRKGQRREFTGNCIPAPYAADVRKGCYPRIDVTLA